MLKITNTLTRKKEKFVPIEDKKVRFYQCGPTVYSRQHIGNLSAAVRGDLIRRALKYLGYDVKYVRNITDVGHLVSDGDEGEDKMAKGAKKERLSPQEIAEKYTSLYHNDLQKLNVIPPDVEPKATEYVYKMAEFAQTLLDKGYAYAREKAIYFDVDKFPEYNKLNRQKLEKNKVGAGFGDVEDDDKKNPYDFALWFFKVGVHKNALQTWEYKFSGINQPTLHGFPGWHIECSAMALSTLGETIDIHMGGVEHIAVHHTNEIAQSEALTGKEYVKYWLHHEHLLIDGEKMSKSKGNIFTLDDLEQKGYRPLDFRYFLLSAHYRSKQNFTFKALDASARSLDKILEKLNSFPNNGGQISNYYKEKFINALEDDFNIAVGLSVLWEVLSSNLSPEDKRATILDFDKVLGLDLELENNKDNDIKITPELRKLLDKREKARKEKNFTEADRIRDELVEKYGLVVIDTKSEQKLRKLSNNSTSLK
ncbi:MAG: cysteine--tRNA ligase [Candidatus Dojkabacteria bacterium]|nr:MAG: cysteine--tRNA ligase [Candidatus Dojkabacteria bacterium]